ncbi:hypothetical protein SHKM778_77630 [Streptomyces sp. KM77-8]|uniref:Uncharacterized protein n=1 Tax=Streptomyces haneummycinicus TaxID=3074435 RepID=A0AAT9HVR5_9ACTN
MNAARWFGSASPDHTARGSAVCVRGTVHWVTHRAGPARALAATPGVRARRPRTFRADGEEWVVWVTDAEGDDALEFAPATGLAPGATPRRIAAGLLGRVVALAMAPDGSRAAVASHDGRVLLVERETGEVREVDRSDNGDVSGLVFSPDSGWLAWSHPGPRPLSQLKLANTTDLSVTEATPLRFRDYAPAFTLDGRHLAFLSTRSFDPVYDAHVFDLAFVEGVRPYLITLAATTPSPFGPQRHGRPFETPDRDETPDSEGTPPPGSTSTVWPTASCRSRWRPPATPICGPPRTGCCGCGTRCAVCSAPPAPHPTTRTPRPTWSATTSPSSGSSISPWTPTTSRSAATASGSCCGPTDG